MNQVHTQPFFFIRDILPAEIVFEFLQTDIICVLQDQKTKEQDGAPRYYAVAIIKN